MNNNKTKWTFFWGGPFSNWYPVKFTYKEIEWENSEQAFMWEKAMTFEDYFIANEILRTPNPKQNKQLGREIAWYDDAVWSRVRYDIMLNINLEKFKQNPKLKAELLKGSNYVEASPYDKIWGIGMAEGEPGIEDPRNWKGQNLLGKVLDQVKEIIQNETIKT